MGKFANKASQHAEKIQRYYDHAGTAGYSQANYHYNQLSLLVGKASQSRNNQNDVIIIQHLQETAESLMQEMKQREEEQN